MNSYPILPSKEKCCGCAACRATCQNNAITMQPDTEGFLQPVINHDKCVNCGRCENVCPILKKYIARKPLHIYGANAKNCDLRKGSSSGGVFTVLAEDVLSKGGVVFGAGFEKGTWRIVHKQATNLNELDELRGSKYVQSDTGDTFLETRRLLESGKQVLYSGCPCQIAGLKMFLGKEYENLLTVDLVCHGVPSPLAWEKYLITRAKEAGGEIKKVIARRFCSWREFPIKIEFAKTHVEYYIKDRWHDSYMQSFVPFWSLRNGCFKCNFRKLKSGSDITLGDYNNIAEIKPEMDDDKGSSVIIVSTAKGRDKIKETIKEFMIFESSLKHVIRDNHSIVKNHKRPRIRKYFFKYLLQYDNFDSIVSMCRKHRHRSLLVHAAWWIKRLIVNREINKFQWN